ncbi:hypothetical protein NicSoilC12_30930 [Arthrobacter sp. NicSoilC12]|nr:hypothetical protein NicSoilC12_30930 [Arthrobacter sp. NicSoilC12]
MGKVGGAGYDEAVTVKGLVEFGDFMDNEQRCARSGVSLAVPWTPMTLSEELLMAYDQQLRTDAETPSAIAVEQLGPLRLVTFAAGRGFVTYQTSVAPARRRSRCGWSKRSRFTAAIPQSLRVE